MNVHGISTIVMYICIYILYIYIYLQDYIIQAARLSEILKEYSIFS